MPGSTRSSSTSAEDLQRIVTAWHRTFASFRFTVEEMVAEGDMVAVRLTLSGTHRGQWQDIAPTGRSIRVTAMTFLRSEGGRVVEICEDYDEYGMRQQLTEEPGRVMPPDKTVGKRNTVDKQGGGGK